jgi:hypothetical protein
MHNPSVALHAHRQLHSFLDELKNGTQNYRTVTSLGEQVAQEYRGRCVIELMQNAHDALRDADRDDPRTITFVLHRSPAPVLLAANSGMPFREEDFGGICQLGQSPKDPNKSVGNKGLGFRSVLEVSSCPEIWSIPPADGVPPFRFAFSPGVLAQVVESLGNLRGHGAQALSPFVPSLRLVDWSPDVVQAFTDRFEPTSAILAAEVEKYLSPYQFPLDAGDMPGDVQSLLDTGHKTVIRLPIDGGRSGKIDEALQSILEQFTEIDAYAMIYLSDVRKLTVTVDGSSCTFRRVPSAGTSIDKLTEYQRLEVHNDPPKHDPPSPKIFHLWRRSIGTHDDLGGREEIRDAVAHLPNRWPEVRSATVGVATEETDVPSQGKFVIFLPTTVATGTGAFVNAPFFGSLDRRSINFADPYNSLLWRYVVCLSLRIIRELGSALPLPRQAQALVDIAGSTAPIVGLERRLIDELLDTALEEKRPLTSEPIVCCRRGWAEARMARSLFPVPASSAVDAAVWTTYAQFAVLDDALQSRVDRVRALAVACGGTLVPSDAEIGATVGALAEAVRDSSVPVSWHGFLDSVVETLPEHLRTLKPHQLDPLRSIRFLPAQSGQLLSATDETALFFQPKRGADEGREFAGDVPASIQPRVAFLHKDIVTQDGPQSRNTPVQKFLDTRFAREFSRGGILRRVVEPAIPTLPVAHDAAAATLCADLLAWTLKLLGTEPLQSLAPVLQKLPVPCIGGWYAMGQATFGPGWGGPLADALQTLADALPQPDGEALLEQSLLPPSAPAWSGTMPAHRDALGAGGVVHGLRLRLADELGWSGAFIMSGYGHHHLPSQPPPGFLQETWDGWCHAVRSDAKPRYESAFSYCLQRLYVLRELVHVRTLSGPALRALSDLLLASFPHWPSGWRRVELKKTEGIDWSAWLTSPLRHAVRTLGWLVDGEQVRGERVRSLSKRWFVREALLGTLGTQRDRFNHLRPLSVTMARRLAADATLLRELTELGLHTYPMEDETSGPDLLDALAAAWEKKRIPPQRLDVFLGQVRDAWRHFDPAKPLPERFILSQGRRALKTCAAPDLACVYLPDSAERVRTLAEHGKAVLEMRGDDARRLAARLVAATRLRRASHLTERALIDGIAWDTSSDAGQPIASSHYAWVPPVLLAIAAFGGTTVTGGATKSWNEASDRLRRARVVDCERIVLDLRDGEDSVASSEPAALWLTGDVLAVCRRVHTDYSLLAGALQSSLGRLDLIRTLRLVLRELSGKAPPSNEEIERALGFAEIDAQSLADIRHRWSGSVSLLVDRLRPVLAVLHIAADDLENAQKDEAHLGEWLTQHLPQWACADLLQAARRSRDDVEMGRRTRDALGDVAELPHWNAALRGLGERYGAVRNNEALAQAKAHQQDLTPELRSLCRAVAIAEGRPERFLMLEKVLVDVSFPTDWADTWWQVPCGAVCRLLATSLSEASVAEASCALLATATSAQDLRERLSAAGVAVDARPFEQAADNLERLRAAVAVLHDVHVVWQALRGVAPVPSPPDAAEDFPPSAYLDRWDGGGILAQSLALVADAAFSAACAGCARVQDVQAHLNLTRDEIERRQQQRQSGEAEAARKKRTYQVAGGAFEVGKDEYGSLLSRLKTAISLEHSPDLKGDILTALTPPPAPGHRSRSGGGGFGKSSHLRPSAELREFLGIVGEMLAYHFLRTHFGEDVVTREAWVSENRLKVLPPVPGERDATSDSFGWDFLFRVAAKDWHIEVKATSGDDENFEMGVSEIEAASRLAGSAKSIWRILRIRQVLSGSPKFDWLPNPFEPEHRSLFRLDRSSARVTYARKRCS